MVAWASRPSRCHAFVPSRGQAVSDTLEQAADCLRRGELAVIPTETVYGLAANALNAQAVSKIFEVKGRPADHPLIVHVRPDADLSQFAAQVPESANRLRKAFWPGPLTMVLRKSPGVPAITTGRRDTVALRAPNHPIALALLEMLDFPLAAPSANRFMSVSPTTVEDLDGAIRSKACGVVDGGPCQVGIESTVVDLTGEQPAILRPGMISRAQIEAVLGVKVGEPEDLARSPGTHPRHYAPRTKLILKPNVTPEEPGLVFGKPRNLHQLEMQRNPEAYAKRLYSALIELDKMDLPLAFVELPPDGVEWEAIHDRLRRAAQSE
ncbi:MAG: threonylcarbamoyl-AMP synthase [Armatimonadetes bacterium]|nr:threonylcarbamoyl-AMP synthase [Armatimonadota bacterium]